MQSKIEKKHKNVARYKYEKEIACVASVSIGLSIRWRRFSLFGCAKIGAKRNTDGSSGEGEGRREKETLARKPHDFEKRPFDTFAVG